MRRNYKNQRKKSLLAKTLETLKESDYDNFENNYDIINKKLFQKTFNKNLNRNLSSKIFSYNQKKYNIQSYINNNDNKDYSKNILIKI